MTTTQGISIKPTIGIGDGLQYSSLPENYFRANGIKLYDVSRPWFFDHNPYVDRDGPAPKNIVEMWNFGPKQYEWPRPRGLPVYQSNAEIWASLFGVPVVMNRPRLYMHEDYAFEKRQTILLQTRGRSHGDMPDAVMDHVIKKYLASGRLFHIGTEDSRIRGLGIPRLETPTLWSLAAIVSQARMLIGLDSGPAWVAACYPDVVVKKVRTRPNPPELVDWVPLQIDNIHSHWDDRCHQVYNITDVDIGFTQTYRKI